MSFVARTWFQLFTTGAFREWAEADPRPGLATQGLVEALHSRWSVPACSLTQWHKMFYLTASPPTT